MKLITDYIKECSTKYGSQIAFLDEYSNYSPTFKQFYSDIKDIAATMQHLGVSKGMHIAQFSENSSKWTALDRAIMLCGAVNAVRGSLAPVAELEYIYKHSESEILITDSIDVINNLKDFLVENKTKFIIYIGNKPLDTDNVNSISVITFDYLLEQGKNYTYEEIELNEDDLATLIYSSGTTGQPKGVMLTHKNIASQLPAIQKALYLKEGKTALLVLPIWHAYERTCEYYASSRGMRLCYTNIKNFKKDLVKYKPHYMFVVPRIWESMYEGIINEINRKPEFSKNLALMMLNMSITKAKAKRVLEGRDINNLKPSVIDIIKNNVINMVCSPVHLIAEKMIYSKLHAALGGRFIRGISGGGALPEYVDNFLEAVGIEIFEGYGLTETAPVVAVRVEKNKKAGSTGSPLPDTEFLIVDAQNYQPLPRGTKGMVLIKGPQVMKGYYNDPESTKKVLLPNGYFVSGDIGMMLEDNTLILTGRAKDTIVLSNGENIEPEAIEQSCMTSPFVKQIVLAGQDRNALSALVVPNMDAIRKVAQKNHSTNPLNDIEIKNQVLKDLREKVQSRNTYRAHERIANISFVEEEFTPENGLMTQTAKIKKNKVFEKYADKIESMYK